MAPLETQSLRRHWNAFVTRFVTALVIVSVVTAAGIGYAYWFANDQIVNHTKTVTIAKGVLSKVKSTDLKPSTRHTSF